MDRKIVKHIDPKKSSEVEKLRKELVGICQKYQKEFSRDKSEDVKKEWKDELDDLKKQLKKNLSGTEWKSFQHIASYSDFFEIGYSKYVK